MTRQLSHRGPDAEGLWSSPEGRVSFGHRRLSIIDLDGGMQPMLDETEGFALVFNGEIYNYAELRAELVAEGVKFKTNSDTEVLLRLLIRCGASALSKLVGMFAFGFWDESRGELLLARDRVGEKPLFYASDNDQLLFASSFGAIQRAIGKPLRINAAALDSFLTLGYIPAPSTIDQGIHKLPAGHLMRAGADGVFVERYWRVADPLEPWSGTREQAVDRLEMLLDTAVRLRLRSDVPLGVFLSGGVDSSIVAAIAASHSAGGIHTFSISFDEAAYDESAHAAEVARRIGSDHRTFRARFDVVDVLPGMVRHFGEPFGDPSALPVWLLAQETRKHVTVALGGDGGDEGFGGYNWYHTATRLQNFRRKMPASLARGAEQLMAPLSGYFPRLGRLHRAAGMLAVSEAERYAALRGFIGKAEAKYLYTGALMDARHTTNPGFRLSELWKESQGGALRRMRVTDIETYLADCLMPKVDVPTMAHGLEARAPLLDPDLLQFALSLPDEWMIDGGGSGGGKAILKDVLYRRLPRQLFERPKQGFSVPLESWFTEALRERAGMLPKSDAIASIGMLRRSGVRRLVDEHWAGFRDHSQRLYNLLVLDEWLQQQ